MSVVPFLSAVGLLTQGKGFARHFKALDSFLKVSLEDLRLTPLQTYRKLKTGSTEFP